jgi:hypothetical protein
MQSVPITTNVLNSNLDQGEVYSIQHYVTMFVSDVRNIREKRRDIKNEQSRDTNNIGHKNKWCIK